MKRKRAAALLLGLTLLTSLLPAHVLADDNEQEAAGVVDPAGTNVVAVPPTEELAEPPAEDPVEVAQSAAALEPVLEEASEPAAEEPAASAHEDAGSLPLEGLSGQASLAAFDPPGVNALSVPLVPSNTTWNEDIELTEPVTISTRIKVTGSVTLYLNGQTLTANEGIEVPSGSSLTINGPGTLNAYSDEDANYSAIGGSYNGTLGSITINGGTVNANATAGGMGFAAGLGGSNLTDTSGGSITINGGTVTVRGDVNAIGNGDQGSGHGSLKINGGTVYVYGTVDKSWPFQETAGTNDIFLYVSGVTINEDYSGNWHGVIIRSTEGKLYGSEVTLKTSAEIPSTATLTVGNGQTLNLDENVELTNAGTIKVEAGGEIKLLQTTASLTNNKTIYADGAIPNSGGSGNILFKITPVEVSQGGVSPTIGFGESVENIVDVGYYAQAASEITVTGGATDTSYGPVVTSVKKTGGEAIDFTVAPVTSINSTSATFTMPAHAVTVTVSILPRVKTKTGSVYYYSSDTVDIDLKNYVDEEDNVKATASFSATSLPTGLSIVDGKKISGTYSTNTRELPYTIVVSVSDGAHAANRFSFSFKDNSPGYTVTIPATVALGAQMQVTASGVYLSDSSKLQVSVKSDNNYTVKTDHSASLTYTAALTDDPDNTDGKPTLSGDSTIVLTAQSTNDHTHDPASATDYGNNAAGSDLKYLVFSTPTDYTYAGDYKDTLTFTVSIEPRT